VSAPFFVREALRTSLYEGVKPHKRLTIVSAGPGYGKTSTVADYVSQSPLPSAWLNLDAYDRDLEPFFTYLVRGIEANWPGCRSQALPLLQAAADKAQAIPAAVGALCEELAEWAPDGAILVLDDFHAVEEATQIVEATQALVEYLPDNTQLVVISREVPALRLGQLRARRQLVELGVEQLRLGVPEIRRLVEALSGRTPDTEELERLYALTDGWAASVIMAATPAGPFNAAQADPAKPPATPTPGGPTRSPQADQAAPPGAGALAPQSGERAGHQQKTFLIYEYLAQEVFDQLSEDTRHFMLFTSLLPTIDLDLCEKALGLADAARHIATIRRKNLLLSRERENAIEFHYHPILRAFLQDRLSRDLPPDRTRALRQAAAAALAESAPADALDLHLDGQLWDEAEALLRRCARPAFVDAGRQDALMHLLERFPAAVRAGSAWLQLLEGEILRLRGEYDQALDRLEAAEGLARQAGDASARGQALALQAACLGSRGNPRFTARAREALAALPPEDAAGLALAHNALGLGLQAEDPDAALSHLEAALEHYRRTGDVAGRIKVLHNLGLFHTRRGDFDQALAMYGESLRQAADAGRHASPATHANLANVQIYQGRFAEAWAAAGRGLDLAQLLGFRREEGWCYLTLAMAAKGDGDLAKATGYAEAARGAAIALGDRALEAQAVAALAEVALQGGAPERAWELAGQAIAIRGLPPDDPALADFKIPSGRILLALGKPAEAAAMLVAARDALAGSHTAYRQAQVHLLLAQVQDRLGDAEAAAGARAKARELCETHGFGFLLAEVGQAATPAGTRSAAKPTLQPAGAALDLEIRCFGTFAAARQGEAIPSKQWQGHKTKLILAYLLLNRQGATRDGLAEVLYGDELVTRSAILMLLSRLRQALEPDLGKNAPSRYIQFRDGRYYFNFGAKYRLDTEDFEFELKEARQHEGAARAEHLERALSRYAGRYLADLPGEHWVTSTQEHFHLQAMKAFDELLALRLAERNFEAAATWSDRCLAVDSCAESAHRTKMRALFELGNRQDAIRHFQQMERILDKELGIAPGEDSRNLYEAILAGSL